VCAHSLYSHGRSSVMLVCVFSKKIGCVSTFKSRVCLCQFSRAAATVSAEVCAVHRAAAAATAQLLRCESGSRSSRRHERHSPEQSLLQTRCSNIQRLAEGCCCRAVGTGCCARPQQTTALSQRQGTRVARPGRPESDLSSGAAGQPVEAGHGRQHKSFGTAQEAKSLYGTLRSWLPP
jgi:hypothetical protein